MTDWTHTTDSDYLSAYEDVNYLGETTQDPLDRTDQAERRTWRPIEMP